MKTVIGHGKTAAEEADTTASGFHQGRVRCVCCHRCHCLRWHCPRAASHRLPDARLVVIGEIACPGCTDIIAIKTDEFCAVRIEIGTQPFGKPVLVIAGENVTGPFPVRVEQIDTFAVDGTVTIDVAPDITFAVPVLPNVKTEPVPLAILEIAAEHIAIGKDVSAKTMKIIVLELAHIFIAAIEFKDAKAIIEIAAGDFGQSRIWLTSPGPNLVALPDAMLDSTYRKIIGAAPFAVAISKLPTKYHHPQKISAVTVALPIVEIADIAVAKMFGFRHRYKWLPRSAPSS